jgi:Tfp pilus assembly PilM family ATPase
MLPNKDLEADYLAELAPSLGVSIGLAMRRVDQ